MIRLGLGLCLLFVFSGTHIAHAQTEDSTEKPLPPQECLKSAITSQMLIECMEKIYASIEAKRLILESTATHKNFDAESTLDWPRLYQDTLDKSREAFEAYRKAECARKEILYNTGYKSKYDKLTCEIRMTKDRINALQ